MKASELIKELEKQIENNGDLDVEIVKVEGGFAKASKPIVEVSTDGEICIYLEYRIVKCPKCKTNWSVGTTKETPTSILCEPCGGNKEEIEKMLGITYFSD